MSHIWQMFLEHWCLYSALGYGVIGTSLSIYLENPIMVLMWPFYALWLCCLLLLWALGARFGQ